MDNKGTVEEGEGGDTPRDAFRIDTCHSSQIDGVWWGEGVLERMTTLVERDSLVAHLVLGSLGQVLSWHEHSSYLAFIQ